MMCWHRDQAAPCPGLVSTGHTGWAFLPGWAPQACTAVAPMLQLPAGFLPFDLREWCYSTCLECLLCAGIPVLCEQAWTLPGFE